MACGVVSINLGSPATIASVAATAVLGVRFAAGDYRVAAAVLLAVAGIGRAVLLPGARPRMQPDVLQSRGLARRAEASKRSQPRDR